MEDSSSIFFRIKQIASSLGTPPEDVNNQINELRVIIDKFGNDARLLLLVCLIDDINNNNVNNIKVQLLAQEVSSLAQKPNFPVTMCQVIEGLKQANNQKLTEGFIRKLCDILKLSFPVCILIAFGLAVHSKPSVQDEGCRILLKFLPEYAPTEAPLPEHALSPLLKLIATQKYFRENPRASLKCLAALQVIHPGLKFYAALAPTFESSSFSLWTTSPTQITFQEIIKKYGGEGKGITTPIVTMDELIKLYSTPLSPQSVAQIMCVIVHVIDVKSSSKADGERPESVVALMTLGLPVNAEVNNILAEYTLENFVRKIVNYYTEVSWVDVLLSLDYSGFDVNVMCLKMILTTFTHMNSMQGTPFPFQFFFKPWTHVSGQISVLAAALVLSKENLLSFKGAPGTARHLQGLTNLTNIQEPWSHVPLLEALFHIADSSEEGLVQKVQNLLEVPVRECFEVFIMSLCETKPSSNVCRNELLSTLIPMCIAPTTQNAQGNMPILTRLWSSHRDLVKNAVLKLYTANAAMINHINTLGNVEALPDWTSEMFGLGNTQPFFVIDLAVTRSLATKEVVRLEEWLCGMIEKWGVDFAVGFFKFLNRKVIIPASAAGLNTTFLNSLSSELIAVFLKVMKFVSQKSYSQSVENERDKLYDNLMYLFLGDTDKEVEDWTLNFFESIYTEQITVATSIETLKELRSSTLEKQKIYFSVIETLLDEYRFISNYPDKEFTIACNMYGEFINNEIFRSVTLGLCFRQILEGLVISNTEGLEGRKLRFSLNVVQQSMKKLCEIPQICKTILSIPFLRTNYTDMMNEFEALLNNQGNEVISKAENSDANKVINAVATEAPLNIKLTRMGNNLKLSPNDGDPKVPASSIKDSVVMKINNITETNVDSSTMDIKRILDPTFYSWLSSFMVIKRLSSQPNYHNVYVKMLDLMNEKELDKAMYFSTLDYIKNVLKSDSLLISTNDRTSLKNLGTWLGKITLAKNKPIFFKDLDVKDIILASYELGLLSVVIPFIGNLLMACKDSYIFKPPNPWTAGMLSLLSEIYHAKVEGCGLKLNISFGIEILFQNLSVSLETIEPSSILSGIDPPKLTNTSDFKLEGTATENNNAKASSSKTSNEAPELKSNNPSVEPQLQQQQQIQQQQERERAEKASASLPTGPVNLNLFLRKLNPNLLKDVVTAAVEHTLRECKPQICDKYAEIACLTTKTLIIKDFAVEPDPIKLRNSAQMMVATLSAGLVSVEPLEQLHKILLGQLERFMRQPDFDLHPEGRKEAVLVCAQEKMEYCSAMVRHMTVERASALIDEYLAKAYFERRNAREAGQLYYDAQARANIKSLPDVFLPKAGGLNISQLRFYETFSRLKVSNPKVNEGVSSGVSTTEEPVPSSAPVNTTTNDFVMKIERLNAYMSTLVSSVVNISSRLGGKKIAIQALPPDNEVVLVLREIQSLLKVLNITVNPEKALIQKFATQVYQSLSEFSSDALQQQVHCIVLSNLNDCVKGIPDVLTQQIINDVNEAKFNANLIIALICSKLLLFPEMDKILSTIVQRFGKEGDAIVNFAVFILRQVLISERAELPAKFNITLNLLSKLSPHEGIDRLLAELGVLARVSPVTPTTTSSGLPSKPIPPPVVETPQPTVTKSNTTGKPQANFVSTTVEITPPMRLVIDHLLDTWIAVCRKVDSNSDKPETAWTQYLQLLSQRSILQVDENMDAFLKIMSVVVVERTLQTTVDGPVGPGEDPLAENRIDYTIVKYFAKLISLLMKFAESIHTNSNNPMNNRLIMLSKSFSIFVRVLADDHDAKFNGGIAFDQRPYFGFFDMFLKDTDLFPEKFESVAVSMSMLLLFGNSVLNVLLPTRAPGFAFAWLSLLSHKTFLPAMLRTSANRASSWSIMSQLLCNILKFLDPFLRLPAMNPSLRELYKGLLRVLSVILHDFPEFFVENHTALCEHIPSSCIQLRNMIISAVPRKLVTPDAFTTTEIQLQVIPECSIPPPVSSTATSLLESNALIMETDNYLKHQLPVSFVDEIRSKLVLTPQLAARIGTQYNVQLISSLVFYIIQKGAVNAKNLSLSPNEKHAPARMLQNLCYVFDSEGALIVLNAIANHLRYPNSHTLWTSSTLLTTFLEAKNTNVKEQITRVLLERVMTHRPHPFGALFTLVELIRNAKYGFFNNGFTKCSPEIENILKNIYKLTGN